VDSRLRGNDDCEEVIRMSDFFAGAALKNEDMQTQAIVKLSCLKCGGDISEEGDSDAEVCFNAVTVYGKCAGCGQEHSLTLAHD
jgi:hypothetical protein